jgi:hypothetical protein
VIDWGSVPAWLALGGVVVAVAVFVAGRADATRKHAASVYVVITSFKAGTGDRYLADAPGAEAPPPFTKVVIQNDGDLPVVDANVSVWEWGHRRWDWWDRGMTDWWTGQRVRGVDYATIAPHSEATEHEFPAVGLPATRRPGDTARPPVILIFRDGNGRRWVRWPDGRLSRVWFIRNPSRPSPGVQA